MTAQQDDGSGARQDAVVNTVVDEDEDRFWRDTYLSRPYADDALGYDHYRPAYRYGWTSRVKHEGRRWDEMEKHLEREWRQNRGASRLGWGDAREAARDAWQRIDRRVADLRVNETV